MNKKPNSAIGIPAPALRRPGQTPQLKPGVVQPKAISAPVVKKPVAPPAYRPQSVPKVLQPKIAASSTMKRNPPVTPPVHRPPAGPPKVLQKKSAPAVVPQPTSRAAPRPPFTSPVHPQKQQNLVQPMINWPRSAAAPHRAVVQAKSLASGRIEAPAPLVSPGSVIQQARGPKKGKKKAAQKKAVVVLTVGRETFRGQSSGQFGHAEMQALRNYIVKQPSIADAWRGLMRAVKKKVRCVNQPVCGSCTMVLEALGFEPDHVTEFSARKSGGVSWGANMKVRELMEHGDLGDTYQRAVAAGAK